MLHVYLHFPCILFIAFNVWLCIFQASIIPKLKEEFYIQAQDMFCYKYLLYTP